MRRAVATVILAMVLCLPRLAAQNMTVKDFSLCESDLTAMNKETERRDRNGERAALIKIETTLTGFTFEGGTLGIVDSCNEPGEVWVYVPRGAQHITIKHPKLGVLRNYRYPVAITGGRTYLMLLSVAQADNVYDTEHPKRITFHVRPVSASLFINSSQVTLTPDGTYTADLPAGAYDVTASAWKYYTSHNNYIINEASSPDIRILLRQHFGWLKIEGDGDETVLLEGQERLFAMNVDEEMVSGTYNLTIRKPLYKPYTAKVTIKDNEYVSLTPEFVPNFREITFRCRGGIGNIFIDDEQVGSNSCTVKVENGAHRIQCRRDGYKPTELLVTVNASTASVLDLNAPTEQIFGNMDIVSPTPGMEVYLDGTPVHPVYGNTYRIPVGTHNVNLRKVGCQERVSTVEILEGQTVTLSGTLREKWHNVIINTTPSSANITIDNVVRQSRPYGSKGISLVEGTHEVIVSAGGYLDQKRRIDVTRDDEEFDFNLRRKFYDRSLLYIGCFVPTTFRDVGIGINIGFVARHFNMEFETALGLKSYQNESGKCSPISFGLKLGGSINAGGRVLITPQAGLRYTLFGLDEKSSSSSGKSKPQISSASVSGGVRFSFAIANCLQLSLTPEYDYGIHRSEDYKVLCVSAPDVDKWTEGFRLNIDLGFFF